MLKALFFDRFFTFTAGLVKLVDMLWTGVQYKDRPLTKAFMMYWCTRRRIIQIKLNYLLNYRKRSNITGYTSQYAVNILFIFQKTYIQLHVLL